MKVKQSPEDFRVEELTDVRAGTSGEHAFYRLTKTGWTTVDALRVVARRWRIDWRRISYGGMKDRHAHTVQYVSIFRGPRRNLSHTRIAVEYLGQIGQPYTSADIRANHFAITLRDLSEAEAAAAARALESVKAVGVPNYFDDQRFGSVGLDDRFAAKHMVLGEYEEALRVALASPNEHDRAEAKREKAILNEHWGDWQACVRRLPPGHVRDLAGYLAANPGDFAGALARLRPELRGLYLSAYQSHLWNRMLAEWLRTKVPAGDLVAVRLRMGAFPMPVRLPEEVRAEWETLALPLPSARLRFDPGATWAAPLQKVLDEEGLSLDQIKLRGFRKPFFSKGDRAAALRPSALEHTTEPDERHPGRRKLWLAFELPRGAYATMVVKRITAGG